MKHFIHPDFFAPNVLTVSVDPAIVSDFQRLIAAPIDDAAFGVVRPSWNSDLQWISATSRKAFELFQTAFDRLGIASHVAHYLDLERQVRLYSGFLVIRSTCSEPDFHVDWEKTNNEAFTMMTPITANAADFGLLYKNMRLETVEYDYKRGEAIIFGDHFIHSTKPGRSDEPVGLLCFTFGSDKMEHWGKIRRSAGYQSRMVCRPDGKFVPTDLLPASPTS
jgi:hypothetical protein